ncbi:hypothetical protein BURPS305_5901 [Burkholderia pseudomallei 305]|nr:hypothetical protein BURPS305_5901 [Burkholderia pseudomallei 305]
MDYRHEQARDKNTPQNLSSAIHLHFPVPTRHHYRRGMPVVILLSPPLA